MAFSTDFAAAGLDVAGGTTSPSPPTACSLDAPMTGGGASAVEPMSGDTAGDEPEVHRRLRRGPLGPLRLVLRSWKPSLQPPKNRDCLDETAGEAQPFSTPTSFAPPPLLVGPPLRRRLWGHQSILDSVPFRKVPLPACVPQGRSPGKGPLLWASQPVLGAASLPQGVFGVFVKGVPGDVDRVHRQAVVHRRTERLGTLQGLRRLPYNASDVASNIERQMAQCHALAHCAGGRQAGTTSPVLGEGLSEDEHWVATFCNVHSFGVLPCLELVEEAWDDRTSGRHTPPSDSTEASTWGRSGPPQAGQPGSSRPSWQERWPRHPAFSRVSTGTTPRAHPGDSPGQAGGGRRQWAVKRPGHHCGTFRSRTRPVSRCGSTADAVGPSSSRSSLTWSAP